MTSRGPYHIYRPCSFWEMIYQVSIPMCFGDQAGHEADL